MLRLLLDIRRYRLFLGWVIVSSALLISSGCGGGGARSGEDDSGETPPRGENISDSVADSSNPVIAADSDGNVYVAWEEAGSSPSKEIYLASSDDSGATFSTKKKISRTYCSNPGSSASEDIGIAAGEGGSLYIAWVDSWHPSPPTSEIKFFREDNSSCSAVSNTFSGNRDAFSPDIALSNNGKIHIVWAEETGGQSDISYVRSEDGGMSFLPSGAPANISHTLSSDSSEPMLSLDDPLAGSEGTLSAGDSNIGVVWVEGSEPDRAVSFRRSADGGVSFSDPQTISDSGIDSHCPAITASGEGKIYVAYKGEEDIYFARWQPAVAMFSTPEKLSNNSLSPSCPEIAVSSNRVIYVLWSDIGDIWVSISFDGGLKFSLPKNVSFPQGTSSSPKMAVAGKYVNIVWVEEEIGDGDIFFSGSADNGKTFLESDQLRNFSNSSSPSRNPVISTDGNGHIYVAWEEGSTGSKEIYFLQDEGAWGISRLGDRSFAKFLDISGDGKSDVVLAAPLANGVGEVYVFNSDDLQSLLIGTDLSASNAKYTLSAGSSEDQFGYSVAIGGDINGDGYSDILVGAPYADNGITNNGKVYIYYGNLPNRMDTTPDIVIRGVESNDHLGFAVSPAGDVNGDGFDDIIIGAPDAYRSNPPLAGSAYIFYGGPFLGDKPGYPDNLYADDADVILTGEESQDKFGSSTSWAGDFNGDGYGDVIVGAPLAHVNGNTMGQAYIYFGGPAMNADVDVTITAAAFKDWLGSSVSRAGDVDANGCGDVVVGAPYADAGGIDRGAAYILYGHGRACDGMSPPQSIDLSNAGSSVGVLNGSVDYGHFGISVEYGGKVNSDSYDDVIIGGLYQGTKDFFISGRAYIYFGGQSVDGMSPFELIGEVQTDEFGNRLNTAYGSAIAGAGDVDGDGYYDALVGAFRADQTAPGGTITMDTGKVYLYRGGQAPENNADATFTGDVKGGWMGYSLK